MSQPMLCIKPCQDKPKAIANLLPCRVHHTGPIDLVSAFWNPTKAQDGTSVSYFRGRRLQGKAVKLPEQCRGVVVERRTTIPVSRHMQSTEVEGDEDEPPAEIGTMQVTSEFDEMVVWSHEAVADASDPYVRSVEEWVQVADQIHSYSEPSTQAKE